jgi:Tol biopolymer transport system component
MTPDVLLVGRNGGVMARRLSADRLTVSGEPVPVAPRLLVSPFVTGWGSLRASGAGHIVYRASAPRTQLVWLDRAGRQVATVGDADDTATAINGLSPDGRTVVVQRTVDGNSDVWIVDLERRAKRRLTVEPGFDGFATFSPDGRRVAHMSDAAADVYNTLYERNVDGTGDGTQLVNFGVPENHYPSDWSPDGQFILHIHEHPKTQSDVLAIPTMGSRQPVAVANTRFNEGGARFSPDGAWVAYYSDETGSNQVFVRPFPGPGPNRQISSVDSYNPRWRRDGRELFFVERDRLMSVSVSGAGASREFGSPRALFTFQPGMDRFFEPSADGQRFLITRAVTDASPITVILNWNRPIP